MRIAQGRNELELHEIAAGEGRALLLLHALYGSSADWGEGQPSWPGPIYGLDFAGHGRSQWIRGGAYTPEILACNVDEALRCIGAAALAGAGVGAYVALLVAGARRDLVPASLLLPGAGLAGGGAWPSFEAEPRTLIDLAVPRDGCDRMACALEYDLRPLDYVAPFARRVRRLVLFEDGDARPPWWDAARRVAGAQVARSLGEAFAALGT
jgi:pimeloyl-ACP methyl ester carboxylesterase